MRLAAALLLLCGVAARADGPWQLGGHTKLDVTHSNWPADSLFRDLYGASSLDATGELRLNIEWKSGGWSAEAAWQLIAAELENDRLGSAVPGLPGFAGPALPNDDRRLFDLTDTIRSAGDFTLLQRLDRLWLAWSSDKIVVRAGRQALSWGNGYFYAPMDLVNPFDPSSVDTEYKTGDDMLYLQYLEDSGADLQAAFVGRRDVLTGDVESDLSTEAAKYHGFAGASEYDLLVARHYGGTVLGAGLSRGVGGAVIGADVVITDTGRTTATELVVNAARSWVFRGRNMTGTLEYYFNGFGLDGDYSLERVAAHPDLAERLDRGQQYTLGRHYLAASVGVEMTPLWTLTPVVLASLNDPSALLQLTTNLSLRDNLTLLGSASVPVGPEGSEFGGVPTGIPDGSLAGGPAIFVQLAWYF